ncbi:hypothetical protein V8C35DRAFT_301752 [Trichoderma chlorosporum]
MMGAIVKELYIFSCGLAVASCMRHHNQHRPGSRPPAAVTSFSGSNNETRGLPVQLLQQLNFPHGPWILLKEK